VALGASALEVPAPKAWLTAERCWRIEGGDRVDARFQHQEDVVPGYAVVRGVNEREISDALIEHEYGTKTPLPGTNLPAATISAMNKPAPFLWFNRNPEAAAEFTWVPFRT
jgi:hypothetical protein